jgi:hypothetical protein
VKIKFGDSIMTLITLKKATIFVAGLFLLFVIVLLVADGFFLPKEYLDPWSKTYHEQFEDPRVQVLAHGVLASNSHNLQSWRVVLEGEDSSLLYVDTTRLSPKADPPGRQVTISQGTFLEYVRVAAENLGYKPKCSFSRKVSTVLRALHQTWEANLLQG